jgi:fructose-1,6-bisphosphatase/sedoheptulose 1,7-bisphosphatase-like protein
MGQELRTEQLSLDFLRVCEAAAIAAARTMGQGDRKYSDHVAVEAMRDGAFLATRSTSISF